MLQQDFSQKFVEVSTVIWTTAVHKASENSHPTTNVLWPGRNKYFLFMCKKKERITVFLFCFPRLETFFCKRTVVWATPNSLVLSLFLSSTMYVPFAFLFNLAWRELARITKELCVFFFSEKTFCLAQNSVVCVMCVCICVCERERESEIEINEILNGFYSR